MTDLSNPIYHDEDKARDHLESIRWPDGAVCPFCDKQTTVSALGGKSMGKGWYHCSDCRKKFTVRVGSVFERSHIPLHKWVLATHLMSASKKGMSAHQLHRMLGITYKSAWFMAHRIREAMRDDNPGPMGGGTVQADETYFGKVENPRTETTRGHPFTKSGKSGPANKRAVVSLIAGGKSRTFHVKKANAEAVRDILVRNVSREAELHTDESRIYTKIGEEFKRHRTVNHSTGVYHRDGVTTNNVENYFSIFKRGMKGIYQHCAEKHLQRYIDELDFRYNSREHTDSERAALAIHSAEGRRLTYRRIDIRAYV